MRVRRGLVAITVAVCLTFTAFTPSRARADNLPVLIAVSVGAFVAFVALGAWLTTSRNAPFSSSSWQGLPPGAADALQQGQRQGVRFGAACRPGPAGMPLVCW